MSSSLKVNGGQNSLNANIGTNGGGKYLPSSTVIVSAADRKPSVHTAPPVDPTHLKHQHQHQPHVLLSNLEASLTPQLDDHHPSSHTHTHTHTVPVHSTSGGGTEGMSSGINPPAKFRTPAQHKAFIARIHVIHHSVLTCSAKAIEISKLVKLKTKNSIFSLQNKGKVSPQAQMNNFSPTRNIKKKTGRTGTPGGGQFRTKNESLTSQEVLKIIGTSSSGHDKGSKIPTPLQDLLNNNITENEFANILERQSPEMRRVSIKELATQFKKLMTLLSFTSTLAGELDLEKGIDQISHHVCEILKADTATVYLIDEQANELWAKVNKGNYPELRIPIGKGIASHVAKTGESVNIANAYSNPNFYPEIDQLTGYHTKSVLCMPVKDDSGKIVALLQALNKYGGAFTEEDEHIMKTLCIQTSISLRNSQMYTASLMTQHKIQVLLDVANQLSSELETTSLITTIMQKARELLDADRCTLFLLDKENEELWSKIADGTQEIRFPMRIGIAGHVATTGEILNIPDAYNDKRFNKDIDLKTGYRTRTILCMPLRNNQGQIIGVTQMINKRDGVFDKEDEELLNAFSAQAGVAIENSILFQRTLEMSNFMQSILRSITNWVLTFDEEGKMTTSNKNVDTMIGIKESVLRSSPYHQWLGAQNAKFAESIAKVYRSPSPVHGMDYEFKRIMEGKDAPLSMNYTVVPLLDFKQTQRGVVVVIEDITPQKRMMTTLGRYMSPALAEQVVKEGGDRLGGVHCVVSTLFIDIRNFTTMSETMDAAEVVEMLNEYFHYMVSAIFEENGVLDKYIGDAVMAVYGVPFSAPDDALRACRTALQMLRNLRKFNSLRVAAGKPPIKVGIGINTGRVLSGNIGSEKRLEYTVIGDGVNVASRIEGVTKQYGVKILISEFTYAEVAGQFITREVDSIKVVGKQKPVRIYELLGANEDEVDPRLLKALPFFAEGLKAYREREWMKARRAFQGVSDMADDPTSKLFISRCTTLMNHPPPPDWDGSYTMDAK